jgi:hypothetical protein
MVRLVDFGDYPRADIQRILDSRIPYQSQNERKLAEVRSVGAHARNAQVLSVTENRFSHTLCSATLETC